MSNRGLFRVTDRSAGPVAAAWMAPTDTTVSIPYEIKEAVELWARQWGRHGTVRWNAVLKCAEIQLTLRDDDPRLRKWQERKVGQEPKESIPLMYQKEERDDRGRSQMSVHMHPLNIHELGVSGVLEILNRGNMQSGTGEFESLLHAARAVGQQNDRLRRSMRDAAKEGARETAREIRWAAKPRVAVPDTVR